MNLSFFDIFLLYFLLRTDLQNKFLTEISNNLKNRFKKQILYAWGNNNSGQLGLPPCNTVGHPLKVPLPDLAFDDEIEKMECGWKISCFLTKKHKLFLSEASEKKQAFEKVEPKVEEEKGFIQKIKRNNPIRI